MLYHSIQRSLIIATAFWVCAEALTAKASKSAKTQKPSPCTLSFDIYGNSQVFKPSKHIEVNDQCEYTATIMVDLVNANVPFPTNPPQDCTLESTTCNGVSCLLEVRNSFKLGKSFEDATGFNHIGIDWSPCGHPPLDKFGRPHYNLHIFRVTPEDRQDVCCVMDGPFVCAPLADQTYSNGKKFYVWGTDTDGNLANVPATFSGTTDTAVPGEASHAWDLGGAQDVADWDKPILIEGLYDGSVQFWEPMFPYEFVSGDAVQFYEEDVSYVSQTIDELPSYWSMRYDPVSKFTTLTMKGIAKNCHPEL